MGLKLKLQYPITNPFQKNWMTETLSLLIWLHFEKHIVSLIHFLWTTYILNWEQWNGIIPRLNNKHEKLETASRQVESQGLIRVWVCLMAQIVLQRYLLSNNKVLTLTHKFKSKYFWWVKSLPAGCTISLIAHCSPRSLKLRLLRHSFVQQRSADHWLSFDSLGQTFV